LMTAEDLTRFEPVATWLAKLAFRRSGSVHTHKRYLQALSRFCRFAGKNPDELIALGKQNIEAAETLVMTYFNKLQDEKKSRSTCVVNYAVIRSFYKHNHLRFQETTPTSWTETESRPLTKEEITRLMEFADIRLKAFLAIMKDTGLAPVDILKLRYGDVKDNLETIPAPVKILRSKTKTHFVTFIGPDGVKYLKAYLEDRKRGTAKIKPEALAEDSSLFRGVARFVPMTYNNLSKQFNSVRTRAGVQARIYDLRKFFQTQLVLARVNEKLIEYWMGHTLARQKIAYLVPTIQEQAQEYLRAYPRLSLSETESTESLKQQWKQQFLGMLSLNPNMRPDQIEVVRQQLDKFRDLNDVDWEAMRTLVEKVK